MCHNRWILSGQGEQVLVACGKRDQGIYCIFFSGFISESEGACLFTLRSSVLIFILHGTLLTWGWSAVMQLCFRKMLRLISPLNPNVLQCITHPSPFGYKWLLKLSGLLTCCFAFWTIVETIFSDKATNLVKLYFGALFFGFSDLVFGSICAVSMLDCC